MSDNRLGLFIFAIFVALVALSLLAMMVLGADGGACLMQVAMSGGAA